MCLFDLFPSYMQALQLGQDPNSSFGFFNGQRCQMCLRTDTLQKVMERLAVPGNLVHASCYYFCFTF